MNRYTAYPNNLFQPIRRPYIKIIRNLNIVSHAHLFLSPNKSEFKLFILIINYAMNKYVNQQLIIDEYLSSHMLYTKCVVID